jgi:hypothetical protein
LQRVGKAFGLKNQPILNLTTTAQDAIARAGQDVFAHVHGPGPIFELADEKFMQGFELVLARLAQVDVGEQAPDVYGCAANPGVLDLAEPAHEMGHRQTGYAVGQQKVQIFLGAQAPQPVSNRHHCFILLKYKGSF